MSTDFLDRYSRGQTWLHRWPAGLKLALAISVMLGASLISQDGWPALGALGCAVFVALSLAQIPLDYLSRRLWSLLPWVAGMGLAYPLSEGFAGGWDTALFVGGRVLVAFFAGVWLVNVTPFERLLAALQRCGLPRPMVWSLALMYRYLFVIFDELGRIRQAQRSRTLSPRTAGGRWQDSRQLVSRLLIRALDRGARIHGGMEARGFRGQVRVCSPNPP